jgi:sirohydrochlorin cobaltochelatase
MEKSEGARRMVGKKPAIVVIGHGSPLPGGNEHFRDTFRKLALLLPDDWHVREAFLEHAEPDVETVLEQYARMDSDIFIFPFLLFDAGHSKSDVWTFIHDMKRKFPKIKVVRDWAIGTDQVPVSVLLDLLPIPEEGTSDRLILVGRGSMDPNANASLYYQGRRLWERRGGPEPVFSFIGVTQPRFKTVLEELDPEGFDRLLVAPYFLFEGILMDRIRDAVSHFLSENPVQRGGLVTPPFGDHPLLLASIADRLRRLVIKGATAMPKWVQLDPSPTLSTL